MPRLGSRVRVPSSALNMRRSAPVRPGLLRVMSPLVPRQYPTIRRTARRQASRQRVRLRAGGDARTRRARRLGVRVVGAFIWNALPTAGRGLLRTGGNPSTRKARKQHPQSQRLRLRTVGVRCGAWRITSHARGRGGLVPSPPRPHLSVGVPFDDAAMQLAVAHGYYGNSGVVDAANRPAHVVPFGNGHVHRAIGAADPHRPTYTHQGNTMSVRRFGHVGSDALRAPHRTRRDLPSINI